MKKILTALVAVALAQSVYSINTNQLERATYQLASSTESSTNNGRQDYNLGNQNSGQDNAKATKLGNGKDDWREKSKKTDCDGECTNYKCANNIHIQICGGNYDGPFFQHICSYAGEC